MRLLVPIALVAAMIALVFHEPITNNFNSPQWEDAMFFSYETGNMTVANAFRLRSYWPGLYRPLPTNLYYYLARTIGEDPAAHRLAICHTISIALFAVNVLLGFWVCRSFTSYGAALVVALLFGSRLASTETMLYTSQMQTLLPVTFSLLAIKAYLAGLHRDYHPGLLCASAAFVFLGLLSKETVVTIPALCLLIAFAIAPSSRRRPAVQIGFAALPVISVLAWYIVAHSFLSIQHNPYWQYDWSPLDMAGNFVAYLISFSNFAVRPVRLVEPNVFLNAYPTIMQAQQSLVLRIGFWVAVALSATAIFLARWGRGMWRPSRDLLWTALGLAIFVTAVGPVVIFKERLLMYYGYFGTFGLSVAVVGAAQLLVRWLLAYRNHGLVMEEMNVNK